MNKSFTCDPTSFLKEQNMLLLKESIINLNKYNQNGATCMFSTVS